MRVCSQAGVFLYGRVRRTDWLPVDGSGDEQLSRSAESESEDEYDDVDRELDELYSDSGSECCADSDLEYDDYPHGGEDASDDISDAGDYERGLLAMELGGGRCSDLGGLAG